MYATRSHWLSLSQREQTWQSFFFCFFFPFSFFLSFFFFHQKWVIVVFQKHSSVALHFLNSFFRRVLEQLKAAESYFLA